MRRGVAAALGAALATCGGLARAQPQPLTPIIDALPESGTAPLTVLLSGVRSTGKWGSLNEIETWEWDFTYDGASFAPAPSHLHNATVAFTFDRPGSHVVRLRITDVPNDGVPREAFVDALIEVSEAPPEPSDPSPYPPGAWGAGIQAVWASAEELAAADGYVRPVRQAFMQWAHVEPETHGSYDWSRLDAALAEAASLDQRVAVQINSELPDWVFDHIAQTGTARDMRSPQFWDPDYVAYYESLIEQLGAHLASSPHGDLVLYVRQQWNAVHTETTHYDSTTSGDAMGTWIGNPAWVWPPDGHRYEVEWTEAIALEYERRIIDKFLATFRPRSIGVTLRALSSHLPEAEQLAFYEADDPAAWLLFTNATYGKWDGGMQHTREFSVMRCLGALGFEETWGDSAARIAERNPELSTAQDIYGVVLRALEVGLPYIGLYGEDLALAADDEEVARALDFGNRYAGWHRHPRAAPGAWLVLGRFEGTTDWRRLQTLAEDNWGMFLRQNDPSSTSTPVALVGEAASRFGLTARRLDAATTFDLDDSFADGVRGVQLDLWITLLQESGSLGVEVDQGGSLVELAAQENVETLGWRRSRYRLTAPDFSDGPDGQTDLRLSVAAGAPVIHSIELRRTDLPAAGGSGSGGGNPGSGGNDSEGGAPASRASGADGGCGCSVVGQGGAPWWASLAAIPLFLLRRRRGLPGAEGGARLSERRIPSSATRQSQGDAAPARRWANLRAAGRIRAPAKLPPPRCMG